MYRAAFFALGVCLAAGGSSLFFVDQVTLTPAASAAWPPLLEAWAPVSSANQRAVNPPDWAPFSSLGLGIVTMLYALALPRR